MVMHTSGLLQSFQHLMAQSTPFIVLVAALLINTLSCCSAENVYCVIPTATSCSSCPHNTHCATLSEYAQEAELYFISDTTMVFLQGDHTLDTNITVANVDRLTMRGQSSSGNRTTIACNGSVGLNFTNMAEFKIDCLAFTSCNRKYAIALRDIPLYNVLLNCSFHDNPGTALVVNNANITLSGKSEFRHNSYLLLEDFYCVDCCMRGGAVTAIHSNLIFTGNTTFLENSAILLQNGTTILYPTHPAIFAIFLENGRTIVYTTLGAISALDNTVVNFDGTSNFINNSAVGSGGAIYATDNTEVNFNGTSNFINNSADYGGGAISASGGTVLNFTGTSNFINNSADSGSGGGGAIYATDNTVVNFNGTSNFINNSADYGGGAISASGGTVLNFTGTSNFINNSADSGSGGGGAIYTSDNTVIHFSGTSNFINNSAAEGGATCTIGGIGDINFTGTSNFINNSAYYVHIQQYCS